MQPALLFGGAVKSTGLTSCGKALCFERARLQRTAEEIEDLIEIGGRHPSGAKARFHFAGLMRGLKTPASLRFDSFRNP
jgi:hypothetical protein